TIERAEPFANAKKQRLRSRKECSGPLAETGTGALGSSIPPFRQARFRNFRDGGLVIMRGVIEEGQARACRISKIDNIQRRRFLIEIIAVSPWIESEQRTQ